MKIVKYPKYMKLTARQNCRWITDKHVKVSVKKNGQIYKFTKVCNLLVFHTINY